MTESLVTVQIERTEKAIFLIRGEKVMLDRDLASLYGVTTSVLKQTVRRNIERFPHDFIFELDNTEFENWRSSSNAELAKQLKDLERKYDRQFKVVFDAIRQLMTPPEPKRKQIGFHTKSLKR